MATKKPAAKKAAAKKTTAKKKPAAKKTTTERPNIAERVRFWEEQDRINQELIPRVIRQNELLSQHIAEHDNLQQILNDTIQTALGEQAKQYEAALENAQTQLNETHEQSTQMALGEQTKQYEAALENAKAELQATLTKTLDPLRQDARRTRNRLTTIAVISAAFAITALVVVLT